MIDRPERVRVAGWQDEERIYEFLIELHRYNERGWGWPFRPEIVLAQIEAATRPDPKTRTNPNDKRLGRIGLIEAHGEIVASTGVYFVSPVWFTDAVAPQELWLYVKPEHRSHGYDKDLFDFAIWLKELAKTMPEMKDHPLAWPLYTGFQYEGRDERTLRAMDLLWRRRSRGRLVGQLYRVD